MTALCSSNSLFNEQSAKAQSSYNWHRQHIVGKFSVQNQLLVHSMNQIKYMKPKTNDANVFA